MLYTGIVASRFPTERHLEKIDERDKFKYKELATSILDEVILQMETPNCLGIYGNWGSGKSTILHFLKDHIAARESNATTNLVTVHFEPWKYEYAKDGDLVFALLRKIEDALPNKKKAAFQKLWKQVGASLLTIGAWSLKTSVNLTSLGQFELDPRAIAEDMQYYKKLVEPHNAWVDEIEGLRDRFEDAIDKGLPTGKTLLVFIDDLDRCLPDNTVKLIEALKNFLNAKRTIFVVAVDRRVVASMIQQKYGLHHGYGEEYLMKVLPYFFELPRVEIADLVKDAFAAFGIPSDNPALINYVREFLVRFAAEPRKAKYYLHQFGMKYVIGGTQLKSTLAQRYSSAEAQHGSRLADFFLFTFVAHRFPRIMSQEHPFSSMMTARDRSIDRDRHSTTYGPVESMLSDEDWNALGKILRFGFWQGQEAGRSISHDQVREVFPLVLKYIWAD